MLACGLLCYPYLAAVTVAGKVWLAVEDATHRHPVTFSSGNLSLWSPLAVEWFQIKPARSWQELTWWSSTLDPE